MLSNDEILFDILFHLPYEEALDKLLVCQDFYRILSDPYFWKKKLRTDFELWWKNALKRKPHHLSWKKLYDINASSHRYSIYTLTCENPELGVPYLTHAINEENYKLISLYFINGINDILDDNERLTALDRVNHPRLYWTLVEHLCPSNPKFWQHAANNLLNRIIIDSNTTIENFVLDSNNLIFTLEDVFRLIDKSEESPHYFIYITLGQSPIPLLFYKFHERYECEGDIFFKGIGKHKNEMLLKRWERDNGVLPLHFVKQMLLGAVENSHLSFIQYLRSRYPTIVTSEQLLYSCRIIISIPSLDIVKYALECSKVDIPVIETHEVALQKLIKANDIYLTGDRKIYVQKWLLDMENLAREWGSYIYKND